MAELKWWEKPIRMARHEWMADLARVTELDLDELARQHAEEWHVNCEWIIGTPGIAPGLGWMTTFNSDKFEKYPELGDFDMLREYIPYAKKYGIHPLSYLNMHWYSFEFGERHPDWLQIMADGGVRPGESAIRVRNYAMRQLGVARVGVRPGAGGNEDRPRRGIPRRPGRLSRLLLLSGVSGEVQ